MAALTLQNKAHEVHGRLLANANIAGDAMVSVAKDLRTMRDDKLYKEFGYSNFDEYVKEAVGFTVRHAQNFINALDMLESQNRKSISDFGDLGIAKLAAIARLSVPEQTEVLTQPQTIPSTGEVKTVAEMTTRETAEVVKARKAANEAEQKAAVEAEKARRYQAQVQQLQIALKQERNTPPKVEYKTPPEVQEKLEKVQSELADLQQRKKLTSEYESRIQALYTEESDLLEAIRRLNETKDAQEMASTRAAQFTGLFRRSARPLIDAKGQLESLSKDGVIHWTAAKDIRSDLAILYDLLDMVENTLNTIDVTNITNGDDQR